MFKDTYCKTRRYPYTLPMLNFLSDKTSLFLLEYFCNVFHNQGKSVAVYTKTNGKKKQKRLKAYQLTTLAEEVDLRHLPTAYSTSHPPQPGLCDKCGLQLSNQGAVLACGHGYHPMCYGRRCVYCEAFYKNGIFENVDSFLKRLQKGADILTQDDVDDNTNIVEEVEDSEEVDVEQTDVSFALAAAIDNVNYW